MRRAALSAGALTAGASALVAACERQIPGPSEPRAWGGGGGGGYSDPGTVTRYPLRLIPQVSPSGLNLNPQPTTVDLGGGHVSTALGYNGMVPGPTIRARRGDSASILVQNQLSESTVVHWHGMTVPSAVDGGPQGIFPPGQSFNYSFPLVQRACMNWYHPHPHMLTGKQANKGLAGAFIITDDEEAALGLPSGAYEIPIIIKDASLDSSGNLVYTASNDGFLGDIILVNGTRDATLTVDTALYRFRMLNASNSRVYKLRLSSGAPLTIIGNDGGLLEAPVQATDVYFGPAERLDVLIDFRGAAVGDTLMLASGSGDGWADSWGGGYDSWGGWGDSSTFDILEFVVGRSVSVPATIPTRLSTIPKLTATSSTPTRRFVFGGWGDRHTINGYSYDVNRTDFRVPFGTTERWTFEWDRGATHPVHVHLQPFQIQSRSGGRGKVYPWEQGWKDTVTVMSREVVEVLVHFDTYRGIYLMHCHNLEHEDTGMMMNFEIY